MIKKLTTIIFVFAIVLSLQSILEAKNLRLIKEKSFDVSLGEELKVIAVAADVKIESWDRNEVNVKIYGNRKAEENVSTSIERTSEGVYVEIEKEGSWWGNIWGGIELEIVVQLPTKFQAYVSTSGGDIRVKKLEGKGELKTSGGDIHTEKLIGTFDYTTSGGDINVIEGSGSTEASTSGGDIKYRNCSGDVVAKTSGGDIQLEILSGEVYAGTSGGDVRVRYEGENKGMELRTSGGDVNLSISNSFKADADLKCSGGDVDVDAPTSSSRVRDNSFEGEINGGGPKLYCRTSGGDITVTTR